MMATFLNDALTLSQLGISKFQEIIISRKFGQSLELKLNKILLELMNFFFLVLRLYIDSKQLTQGSVTTVTITHVGASIYMLLHM